MANSRIPDLTLSDTLNKLRTSFNQLLDSVGDVSTLETTAGDVTSAINELRDSINVIGLGSLLTTNQTIRQAINEHELDIGDMNLNTTATDITEAINELRDSLNVIGVSALNTTAATLTGAINEHEGDIGNMTFTGLSASDISAALRELRTELGDHTALDTKTTTSAVAAINELRDSMGLEGGLDTRSGANNIILAVNQLNDSIGTGTLSTDATTVIGAINELNDSLGDGVVLKTDVKTIKGAINEISDSIGTGGLTTTSQNIIGAINEHDTEIGAASLTTSATTLRGAINEHDAELGTITAGAMGTTASTVSGAIFELEQEIDTLNTFAEPTQSLNTTATTLADAINEHESDIGNMSLSTDASDITAAINELNDSLGDGINLATAAQTVKGAINELNAMSTDSVDEGSINLYYTTARVDSDMGDILNPGEGIDITEGAGIITIAAETASSSNLGVAKFNTDNFSVTAGGDVTIKNDGVILGTETTGNYMVNVSGTTNEIEVTHTPGEGSTATIGLPNNVTIGNDLTVTGNLTVNGTQTILETAVLQVEDKSLVIGDGLASANDAGGAGLFVGDSTDGTNFYAGFRWNSTGGYWEATDSTGTFYQLSIASPSGGGINFVDDDDDKTFVSASTGGTFKIDGGTSVQTNLSSNVLTVSVDDAATSTKGIASFNSSDFSVSSGAVSIKTGGVSNNQLANSSITIGTSENSGQSVSLGGTVTLDIVDSAEVQQMIDSNFSNTNYVADVAAGSLIDVTHTPGSASTATVNVDLSELTDGTADIVGNQDELVYLDNGTQKRKLISEIKLSEFSNDANWTATTGTVTSVEVTAGNGLSGGGTVTSSGSINLALNFAELSDKTDSIYASTEFILDSGGTAYRKTADEISTTYFKGDGLSYTGDINIDADGDVILDADGNNVIIKNGPMYGLGYAGDTVTMTLDDNANFTINNDNSNSFIKFWNGGSQGQDDIEINASTGGGDIFLDAGSGVHLGSKNPSSPWDQTGNYFSFYPASGIISASDNIIIRNETTDGDIRFQAGDGKFKFQDKQGFVTNKTSFDIHVRDNFSTEYVYLGGENGFGGRIVMSTTDSSIANDIFISAGDNLYLDANSTDGQIYLGNEFSSFGRFMKGSNGGFSILSGGGYTGFNMALNVLSNSTDSSQLNSALSANNYFSRFTDLGTKFSGTQDVDWSTGIYEMTSSSANLTITFSNIPAAGKCAQLMFMYETGSGGGVNLTWPSSVKWNGGVKPYTPRGGNVKQLYQFITYDGGTTVYGSVVGQNFS